MKYTKGNITVSCNPEYMKRTSREDFIAQQAHTGLDAAGLGQYWDKVNGEKPVAVNAVTGEETPIGKQLPPVEEAPKPPRNRSTKRQSL